MSNIFPERQRVPMGTMLCPAMRGTFTADVNSNRDLYGMMFK